MCGAVKDSELVLPCRSGIPLGQGIPTLKLREEGQGGAERKSPCVR